MRHEKEELTRENQAGVFQQYNTRCRFTHARELNLPSSSQKLAEIIQELRRAYADLQAATAFPESLSLQPDREAADGATAAASIGEESQQGASVDTDDLYDSMSE